MPPGTSGSSDPAAKSGSQAIRLESRYHGYMTYDPHSEDFTPEDRSDEEQSAESTPAQTTRKVGRVRWGLLSFLLLLVAITILALQNPQLTEITFLAWTTPEVPVSIIILGTTVIAIILDELFGMIWRLRRRRRRKAADQTTP